VGDSLADLEMGRAAGAARVIGVLSGVSAREDLEPFADALLNSVADLAG
jgi:phosphoglycolate phosphatase